MSKEKTKRVPPEVSAAATVMGRIGGSVKSEAKTIACRENGKCPKTKKP